MVFFRNLETGPVLTEPPGTKKSDKICGPAMNMSRDNRWQSILLSHEAPMLCHVCLSLVGPVNLKIEIIMATCYLSLTLDFVCNCYIDVNSGQPRTRVIICT